MKKNKILSVVSSVISVTVIIALMVLNFIWSSVISALWFPEIEEGDMLSYGHLADDDGPNSYICINKKTSKAILVRWEVDQNTGLPYGRSYIYKISGQSPTVWLGVYHKERGFLNFGFVSKGYHVNEITLTLEEVKTFNCTSDSTLDKGDSFNQIWHISEDSLIIKGINGLKYERDNGWINDEYSGKYLGALQVMAFSLLIESSD